MQILAELDDIAIARATSEQLATIERLLADDPTSPRHVATTTLTSDDLHGVQPAGRDLTQLFERIDADPNQFLAVILDDGSRVIGTFQLTWVPSLAHSGSIKALVSGVRIRSGADSVSVGRRSLMWAADHARAEGARALLVVTDKNRAHVHGFYRTLGFRPTHDGFVLPL